MPRTREELISAASTAQTICGEADMPNRLNNLLNELKEIPELVELVAQVRIGFCQYERPLLELRNKIVEMRASDQS